MNKLVLVYFVDFSNIRVLLCSLLHDSIEKSKKENNPLRLELAEWLRSLEPPLDHFEDNIGAHLTPDENPMVASELKLPVLALARMKRSAMNRMCEDGIFHDAELYTLEEMKGFEDTFKQACKKLRHFLKKGFEVLVEPGKTRAVPGRASGPRNDLA